MNRAQIPALLERGKRIRGDTTILTGWRLEKLADESYWQWCERMGYWQWCEQQGFHDDLYGVILEMGKGMAMMKPKAKPMVPGAPPVGLPAFLQPKAGKKKAAKKKKKAAGSY